MPILSPPIPTHAPPVRRTDPLFGQFGGVGGEAIGPAPLLLWYFGPSAPKDLYDVRSDSVGWVYDGAGRFWEVYPPESTAVQTVDTGAFPNAAKGEGGYLFSPRIGGPVGSSSIFDQIGGFVWNTIIPAAVGILTIVQPEIGIAAAAVYKTVSQIAAGASLTDSLVSAIASAAKDKIPSLEGKALFDKGMDIALDQAAVKKARADLDASVSGTIADALGLKQALETGIATAQTTEIQKQALGILDSELGASGPLPWMAADWNADKDPAAPGKNNIHGVMDFARREGASPTDLAIALFPTPAVGLARLSNAIATATSELVPSATATVKLVTVPKVPLATSGSPVGKSAQPLSTAIASAKAGKASSTKGGSSGGSGSGLVWLGAVAVVGFLWLKGRR